MSRNITYLTTTNELNSVAQAIRAKGGTGEALEYPQGFIDAIDDIETGGGGTDSQPSDNAIIFSDYANAGGNFFTYLKPTKATIKGSADMFNRSDSTAIRYEFACYDSNNGFGFLNKITDVVYDVNGVITRIPDGYAHNNQRFPYPPQSVLDNLTYIGADAYYNHMRYQTGSEALVLPNIQIIGSNAFAYNGTLTSVTIGTYGNSNLQGIGQNAFRACSNLTIINILSRLEAGAVINSAAFRDVNSNCVMNVVWSEGEVSGFPGNFPGTVNYDYVPPTEQHYINNLTILLTRRVQ